MKNDEQKQKYGREPIDPIVDRPSGHRAGMKEQLDWIKRQLEYFNFAEKYKTRYDLKAGEIYEFDWGININAEFSNRHYGVVLMDSDENNPLVLVCPIKTNHNGAHPRSDVDIGYIKELNSTKSSLAVVNQIRSLDKLRIFTKNAIGKDTSLVLSDSAVEKMQSEIKIIRLEEAKLQMILNAYILMITGNKIK